MRQKILNPVSIFFIGAFMGLLSRLLDLYTRNLGNVFSELSIWILFGVLISIFSESKKRAMLHVFLFCVGMLIAYYLTAKVTNGVYSVTFITGWSIFSLCSPVFAYFTWMTKEKGLIPQIISAGILVVTLLASVILFDGPGISDIILLILLSCFLFVKKIDRGVGGRRTETRVREKRKKE